MNINLSLSLPISEANKGLVPILLHFNGFPVGEEGINDATARVIKERIEREFKSMILPHLPVYFGQKDQAIVDAITAQLNEALEVTCTITE